MLSDDDVVESYAYIPHGMKSKEGYVIVETETFISLLAKAGLFKSAEGLSNTVRDIKDNMIRQFKMRASLKGKRVKE